MNALVERHKTGKKVDFSPADKHVIKSSREILKVRKFRREIKHIFNSESNEPLTTAHQET